MKITKVLPIFIALLFLLSSCQFLFSYLTSSYNKDSSSNSTDISQPSSTDYENEDDNISFLDVDSTKEESIFADQIFETFIKENAVSSSSSFHTLGYNVTEEDALLYAKSSALVGDTTNTYKMLKYIGYTVDSETISKAENYSKAKILIRQGNYDEAFQLLGKDADYADSNKLRIKMVENRLINFKIGDIGPAGGYIFYDKGEYSDGWRFLEASPRDIGEYEWGEVGEIGTSLEIGTGKANTEEIVKKLGNGDYAAKACSDYEYNGYDDWFLPSKDELNLMYENLYLKGEGDLERGYYRSSSEYGSRYAWGQNFYYGGQDYDYRSYKYCVLPVRAF